MIPAHSPQLFIALSHWSDSGPLASGTPLSLDLHWNSFSHILWLTWVMEILQLRLSFWRIVPFHTPAGHRWGRCQSGSTQGPGYGPGLVNLGRGDCPHQVRRIVSFPMAMSLGSAFPCLWWRGVTISPKWEVQLSQEGVEPALLLQCSVMGRISYPRASEGWGRLSTTLRLQQAWFLWLPVLTHTMDINMEPSSRRVTDRDMTLCCS